MCRARARSRWWTTACGKFGWPPGRKAVPDGVERQASGGRGQRGEARSSVRESKTRKRPRHPLRWGHFFSPPTGLLDLDRELHAERHVARAIALVRPLGRDGERPVIRLVRLRQER